MDGTITNGGRITIPATIRQHLGLKPGDRLRFFIEDGGRVVLIPVTLHLHDLRGALAKPPHPVSLEEEEMAGAVRHRSR